MKMKTIILFVAGCFFLGSVLNSINSYSQCGSTVKIVKKYNASGGISNGRIEVEIRTQGRYDLKLLEYDSRQETNVESHAGSGQTSFNFKGLKENFLYRVDVIFHDEEKFLCKNRSITNIILTDKE